MRLRKRMAEMLVGQLVEIMPELEDVSPWHDYGQRRSLDEYGRAAERCISEEFLPPPPRLSGMSGSNLVTSTNWLV